MKDNNENITPTLENVKGFLFALKRNLAEREIEIRDLIYLPKNPEAKLSHTADKLRENRQLVERWIENIKGATDNVLDKLQDYIPEDEPLKKYRWMEWKCVVAALDPRMVQSTRTDFEKQNFLNKALFAFAKQKKADITIEDVVNFILEVRRSGLYSEKIIEMAVKQGDKNFFHGNLSNSLRKMEDIFKQVDDVLDPDLWGEDIGLP